MRRLWRESIRRYFGWLVLAVLCMALMAAATAFSAWLMEPVVNEVFIGENRDMLWPLGAAVFATFLVKGLANYSQSMLMSFVGLRIIAAVAVDAGEVVARVDLFDPQVAVQASTAPSPDVRSRNPRRADGL